MSFLKASGVTNGDDLGNFNPDSPITRQEFAVLLCRWLTPAQDTSSVELPFADNGSIADWAKDGVRAMYSLGVTKGSYDGYGRLCFLPTATISRQEALTMLGRLLELGYAAPEWSFTAVQHDVKNASSSCRAIGKSCLRDCVEGLSSPGIETAFGRFLSFFTHSRASGSPRRSR